MATLSTLTKVQQLSTALLPTDSDTGATPLTTSQVFGPFAPGDTVVVACDQPFNMVAGPTNAIVATTNKPKFPANVYKFAMPDNCSWVAMISSGGVGQVYKG